jgi:hypothetical protein
MFNMLNKLSLGFVGVLALGGCGGSSDGSATNPTETQPLTADTPVEVTSIEDVIDIDFAAAEVGSVVTITDGDLEGATIEVVESVGGVSTAIVTLPGEEEGETQTQYFVSSGISSFFEAQTQVTAAGEDPDSDVVITQTTGNTVQVNGHGVFIYTNEATLGTTTINNTGIAIYDENSENLEVSGAIYQGSVGGTTFTGLTAGRDTGNEFSAPTTGEYSYTGKTAVFDSGGDSWQTDTSSMTVNFSTKTGTYQAENFGLSEGGVAKTITVSSDITFDNTNGVIVGSNSTLESGGTSGDIALVGMMSTSHTEVAGGFISDDAVDGLVGGIFALPKVNP